MLIENEGPKSSRAYEGDVVQGGIAQTIGLVFAANARHRRISYPGWPSASIYQFCNQVNFLGRKRARFLRFPTAIGVPDPNSWLDTLPTDMTEARLCVLPTNDGYITDRESVGFANGGPVFLAQIVASRPEAWRGEWHVTNQDEADRRIWSVTYHNVPNTDVCIQPASQQEARDALAKALDDAIQFNSSRNMGFGEIFLAAKNALSDDSPLRDYYHSDLVPTGLLTLSELQLFSCAAKAWVFGGMGSWNDVCFDGDDQQVYRELSDRLFSTMIDGLLVATNASANG